MSALTASISNQASKFRYALAWPASENDGDASSPLVAACDVQPSFGVCFAASGEQ